MPILKMSALNLKNKRVLIREDLNVPIKNGEITSDARIKAALPTIQQALNGGAKVILVSHLGRPTEGVYNPEFSLAPIAHYLSKLFNKPVRLIENWIEGVDFEESEEIVLCENVRFLVGEQANDDDLAKKMANLCDVYVMDAFGAAHRAHASTHGIAKYAQVACAGPLLSAELEALSKALKNPAKPMIAIVGGSKVSTKLTVLDSLSQIVDQLIVGGGIANTFIAAAGYNVGKSLYEPNLVEEAKRLQKAVHARGGDIPIPTDVIVSTEMSENAVPVIKPVDKVTDEEMILDVGPDTSARFAEILKKAETIVWNGPVGVFELDSFAKGTKALAKSIAESQAFSIAGGGDTLAAIDKYGVVQDISYISTGGGVFLEFLEGKELPAVAILEKPAK
jgi:phosphoglycerate kinase